MVKVVYNSCYGGFGLSNSAIKRLAELGNQVAIDFLNDKNEEYFNCNKLARHDRLLIQVVEELGEGASGIFSKLKIEDLFGNIYKIEDYDGKEDVIEAGCDWIVAI